ncbi:hypothetical protein BAY59_01225 [Prauserella coralliicola]|nr:hypothetical protein BAY59_01225 [Prauserella coralliicola]
MGATRDDIAGPLRERIAAGDLKPGDKLPSFRALANQHGAARGTASEAVHLLEREGLVEIRDKSAAVVLAPREAGRTPEARLTDTRADLVALQQDAKDLERRAHDLAERLSAALARLET